MDQLRLRIAEEEHAREERGTSRTNKPGAFIIAGMEIEEQQCVTTILQKFLLKHDSYRAGVQLEVKRRNRTSAQAAELQRKRTLVLGQVQRLRDEQAYFMPGLAALLDAHPVQESTVRPEEMKLHLRLPSRRKFARRFASRVWLRRRSG